MRADLSRAMASDQTDPYLLMTYYRSFLGEPRTPDASAYAAMDRAFALQPESVEIRVAQIYALALRGRVGEARQVAQVIASDPHSSDLGRKTLLALDRIEAAAGKAPEAP